MNRPVDVILLAAGLGSRVGSRTEALPKSLLPLAGRPILDHAMSVFEAIPEFGRVVVVTGFEREKLVSFLGGRRTRLQIEEAFNPDYRRGNFYSVLRGLERARPPFLVTNADHLFPVPLLVKCVAEMGEVSAVCDFDRTLAEDCMKVESRTGDRGRRVVRIHKKLERFDAGYIGMTWVDERGATAYREAVRRIAAENDDRAYAEQVLQSLACEEVTAPRVIDASGFGWLEVDTVADLETAEGVLAANPEFLTRGCLHPATA